MNVTTELLARLQAKQERIRNLCIMAHVDHGKTTLSDHLIGSNGLIHPKLMGELRYLDSREDEQERGITIKSSSISLLYVPGAASRPEGPRSVADYEKLSQGYLINLIDSPGHVDFCSEVSTAARLSDGALVLVDAVEGVCIQTHAVLRQAWEEKVTPCLFINKMDRLITELRMTPTEAYARFQSIVTHANMVMSAFHSERYMSEADAVLAVEEEREAAKEAAAAAAAGGAGGAPPEAPACASPGGASPEQDDGADTFQPALCNVAFGSAHDGWAFRLDQFAHMYAEKLQCKPAALQRALWGDYAFSAKDKRVVRLKAGSWAQQQGGDAGKAARPMFVQFILEPLWKAYGVLDGEDVGLVLGSIVKGRGLGALVPAKALEHPEPKQALRAVLRAWLPLSETVLGMAAAHVPCPAAAAPARVPRLLRGTPGQLPPDLAAGSAAADAPLVVFVPKMVAVPASLIPRLPGEPAPASATDEVFLAFGRVFSGVAREGQLVHVLSAAYTPAQPASQHRQTATLTRLYMMMGRALARLKEVPAGCVLALGGLETVVLKSATLSSTPALRPLAPMTFQAAPIVRVAVEPVLPNELPRLVEGLRLLNRADPFVEVSVLDSGEHVLGAAGEVHLETCVRDLKERFARIQLQVSPPLVAFRETVRCPEEDTTSSSSATQVGVAIRATRVVEAITPNQLLAVRVRASAVPAAVASALEEHADAVKRLVSATSAPRPPGPGGAPPHAHALAALSPSAPNCLGASEAVGAVNVLEEGALAPVSGADTLRSQMSAALSSAPARFVALARGAWQLGPRGSGPNILLRPPVPPAEPGQLGPKAQPQQGLQGQQQGGPPGASLFDVPQASVVRAARAAGPGQHQGGLGQAAAQQQQTPQHQQQQQQQQGDPDEDAPAPGGVGLPQRRPVVLRMLCQCAGGLASVLGLAPVPTVLVPPSAHSPQPLPQEQAPSGPPEPPQQPSSVLDLQLQSQERGAEGGEAGAEVDMPLSHGLAASVQSGLAAGFQLATGGGPLCDEPMWGVLFEVDVRLLLPDSMAGAAAAGGDQRGGGPLVATEAMLRAVDLQEEVYGPFSGQVMTATASALRRAVMEAEPRLAEAYYLCAVQASAEALSGVYAVLGKRRARILREEMREGSDTFLVHAYLPVEASFGLADDMRRRSSGAAAVSLLLSHWERLQVDPFFVPTTEEEREEHGEEGVASNAANVARRLIDAVRRRKGLPVEEKVVKVATKQRTLKRNV